MFAKLTKHGLSKAGWATGGKASVLASGIVLHAFLSHMLSPGEYGSYLLLYSFVLGATLLGLLGADKLIIRLIAQEISNGGKPRATSLAKQVLTVVTMRGLSVSILVCTAILFVHFLQLTPDAAFLHPLILASLLLWVPSSIVSTIIPEIFRGYQDIRRASIFTSAPGLLNIIGLVALNISGLHSLQNVIACTSGTTLLATLIGIVSLAYFWRSEGTPKLGIKGLAQADSKPFRSFSILMLDIFHYILGNLGIWLLAYFSSQQAVAAYGAAARLASLIALPLVIANLVLPPMIAEKAFHQRTEELEGILRRTATLTTLPAFLLLLVYLFAGGEILARLFGPYYLSSYLLLLILSFGQVANVAFGSCGFALVMTGNQRLAMKVSVVSSIAVIAISLLLAANYGALGMAIAASTGMLLQNVFNAAAVRLKLGIWTHLRVTLSRPVREGQV